MSGLVPQAFIDDVLARTDIVDVIEGYVPLLKKGQHFVACCPFHQEKTPSFSVSPKKQFYHCFGCGESGNVIHFIMRYTHQGFLESLELLASRLGLSIPRENQRNGTSEHIKDLYDLLERVATLYTKSLKNAPVIIKQYVKERALSSNILEAYEIGYAPPEWHFLEKAFPKEKEALIKAGMLIQKEDGKTYDRYRHRLMFPIRDKQGRITGFGGRVVDKTQEPKYLNSPETAIFQKSRELYGLYHLLQKKPAFDVIFVVEGYIDVISLADNGVFNAVAALGTATSVYHIQRLCKHTKKIIFCFDGDRAGRDAAWRALENTLPSLGNDLDPFFMFLPDGQDPDSFVRQQGKEAFLHYADEAIPFNKYCFQQLMSGLTMQSAGEKSQLLTRIKPLLQKMPEGIHKQRLITTLSQTIHLEVERLQILLDNTQNSKEIPFPSNKQTIQRTPLRLAIALLIQNPHLYTVCNTRINPDILTSEEYDVLYTLINCLRQQPQLTTPQLIEKWRESELYSSLIKLATWEHLIPDATVEQEFIAIMQFLCKQATDKTINMLIVKSRTQELTAEEKQSLQTLLKKQHGTEPTARS